jgi:hypothetical protein
MRTSSIVVGFILAAALLHAGEPPAELRTFFRDQIGLSDEQIAAISRGQAVAKILPSTSPAEVIVFGAVHVNAAPEQYVRLASNLEHLRRLPGYLRVGRFSDPPRLSDLDGFALDAGEVHALRACRPGKCSVQLPADMIQSLHNGLDWSSPDAASEVNRRIRQMALETLRRYGENGNRALGRYHDKELPFDIDSRLRARLGHSEPLAAYLPGLGHYLLDYPAATLPDADSFFYWERVHFGLKPTLRLNQVLAYRAAGPRATAHVVVVKQLYASHYFQLALDLTACVGAAERGTYLISLRGSTQQGLTGFTGALLRLIVTARTRSAQEKALVLIKNELERLPPA